MLPHSALSFKLVRAASVWLNYIQIKLNSHFLSQLSPRAREAGRHRSTAYARCNIQIITFSKFCATSLTSVCGQSTIYKFAGPRGVAMTPLITKMLCIFALVGTAYAVPYMDRTHGLAHKKHPLKHIKEPRARLLDNKPLHPWIFSWSSATHKKK